MDKNRPKLLVLLSRFPLPLDKGDKLRAYEQIQLFAEHFTVHVICLNEKIPQLKMRKLFNTNNITHEVFVLPKWVSFLKAGFGLFTSKPIQVKWFHSHLIQRKIEQSINTFQPDHMYCQLIRVSEYIKHLHSVPKTLDYMDAFSKGMERRIAKSNFIQKWIFNLEYERLKKYEHHIFDYFENHCMISNQDIDHIHHPKKNNILKIPNGVRESFFEDVKSKITHDAVFVGNLSYAPNVQAVEYIITQLLPAIWLIKPHFTFAAFGAQPHNQLIKLFNDDRISYSGWTDDIRTRYVSARIFIAPLFIGTGLQNKLLEAMALKVPCITTTLANTALQAIENKDILIANTIEEYVAKICALDNEAFALEIALNGFQYVKTNYRWSTATQPLIDKMIAK